jgi:hypothetical protein
MKTGKISWKKMDEEKSIVELMSELLRINDNIFYKECEFFSLEIDDRGPLNEELTKLRNDQRHVQGMLMAMIANAPYDVPDEDLHKARLILKDMHTIEENGYKITYKRNPIFDRSQIAKITHSNTFLDLSND